MRSKGKSRNHRQYVGSYMTFAGKLLISPGKHSKMRRSARIMKVKPKKNSEGQIWKNSGGQICKNSEGQICKYSEGQSCKKSRGPICKNCGLGTII